MSQVRPRAGIMRLPQALAAVLSGTLVGGVAGGVVGAAVGTFAPAFVQWLQNNMGLPKAVPAVGSPAEFGLGLGLVSGLVFGTGVGLVLVLGLAFRDAWLLRGGVPLHDPEEAPAAGHGGF